MVFYISFCILDDELCDYSEEGLLDYLVRTDGYLYNGLSYEHIDMVKEFLSCNKKRILKKD